MRRTGSRGSCFLRALQQQKERLCIKVEREWNHLGRLVDAKHLVRHGAGRGTYYALV